MTIAGAVHGLAAARTFDSLRRHRNYRLYFGGQIVSISGTWMQNTAQAWLVLQLTGSAAAVGVLAVCQFAPYTLLGLAGGVVADRLDRRRTLVVTQSIPIVLSAALAALSLSGHVRVWEVDLLAALYGCVLCVDTPARQAFTVDMVGRRELPNAVALNSSLFNASRIIGPALAGLVIGSFGVGPCFAINAASYVAVVVSLLAMDTGALHQGARSGRPPTVVRGVREGLAYVARTPRIRVVLLMMLFVGTISMNFNVLVPVLAAHTLQSGAPTLGLLLAMFGLGALAGALFSASIGTASWRWLLGGGFGLGIGELVLAPQRTVAAAALLLALSGVAFTLYTSNSNSTLQLLVPDALRGRVLAIYAWVFFGTAPIGGYLAGWLADRGGTSLAFTVSGATATAATIAGALWSRRAAIASLPPVAAAADTGALAVR